MLIEIKVKIELSIIRLDILLERLKQAIDVVHSESRLAQDAHDFKHWPANLEVMRNDGNEAYDIVMLSPSCSMHQKATFFSLQKGSMRHALSNPLMTKCIGTNIPTLKRSINCRPPSV